MHASCAHKHIRIFVQYYVMCMSHLYERVKKRDSLFFPSLSLKFNLKRWTHLLQSGADLLFHDGMRYICQWNHFECNRWISPNCIDFLHILTTGNLYNFSKFNCKVLLSLVFPFSIMFFHPQCTGVRHICYFFFNFPLLHLSPHSRASFLPFFRPPVRPSDFFRFSFISAIVGSLHANVQMCMCHCCYFPFGWCNCYHRVRQWACVCVYVLECVFIEVVVSQLCCCQSALVCCCWPT